MDKIKRKLTGVVISSKTLKTAIVEVKSVKKHPKYHKRYTVTRRFPAHVEEGTFAHGDKVEMVEIPQKSKTKHWQIIRKV
ncbi:MAG: small ribosomal subunit protein uS17 [Acidobacteriaceae bacterium]